MHVVFAVVREVESIDALQQLWQPYVRDCLDDIAHKKNGKRGILGQVYVNMSPVMVFMLLFNVSSLSLMFYVVGVLGLFCP